MNEPIKSKRDYGNKLFISFLHLCILLVKFELEILLIEDFFTLLLDISVNNHSIICRSSSSTLYRNISTQLHLRFSDKQKDRSKNILE